VVPTRCQKALRILVPAAWINIFFAILEASPARSWFLSGNLVPSILNGVAVVACFGTWGGSIYLWFASRPLIRSSWAWLLCLFPIGFVLGSVYILIADSRLAKISVETPETA